MWAGIELLGTIFLRWRRKPILLAVFGLCYSRMSRRSICTFIINTTIVLLHVLRIFLTPWVVCALRRQLQVHDECPHSFGGLYISIFSLSCHHFWKAGWWRLVKWGRKNRLWSLFGLWAGDVSETMHFAWTWWMEPRFIPFVSGRSRSSTAPRPTLVLRLVVDWLYVTRTLSRCWARLDMVGPLIAQLERDFCFALQRYFTLIYYNFNNL